MRMKELLVAGPISNPSLQGQVDSADVCQPLFVRQAGLAMSIDWTEIHFNICIWSSFSWNWSSSVCRCWLTSRRSFIRIAGRESAPYLPLLQIHPRHRQRRQVTLMTMMMGDDDCDFKPAPGPGQSPGLSPHPVFHPPSSPGENFHRNKIRSPSSSSPWPGMPPTPTRLGHPLSFLSPVSPGFPSHLTPSLQVSREGHRQQSNLITPQIFDTKIRIESQMFDCKHTHPLRAREGHRKQSNLTTPKMFVTKIRIESQMFDSLHILEIPPPLRAWQVHRQQSNERA